MNTEKNCKMFFSVFFCLYGGTFDYMAFFEYNYGRNLKEVGNMREKKYYITFDGYERGVMVNALNEMRNALLQQGRYTDAVDEVLLKIIDAKTKKFKVITKEA